MKFSSQNTVTMMTVLRITEAGIELDPAPLPKEANCRSIQIQGAGGRGGYQGHLEQFPSSKLDQE